MTITKTAKIQIYPSDDDKVRLSDAMKAYAKACDFVSQYIYDTHDLSQSSVHKAIYRTTREVCGTPSQMTCNAIRTVIGSYKTNLSSGKGWVRCVFKSPQLVLSWDRTCRIVKQGISIGVVKGRVICDFEKRGMENYFTNSKYHFGATRLVNKFGKFFLHISINYEVEDIADDSICNVVGIDRGVRFIAATYDSKGKTHMYSGKSLCYKREQYNNLRQELQMVGTPSSRKRLMKIGQRENRWMQDINHCVTKSIVESNPKGTLFVLEDLEGINSDIKDISKDRRNGFVSWAFYDFEKKLTYKALERGQKVIKVNPKFTSQTCPKCGHIDKRNRNKRTHTFCCKNCGYKSNDDRVGAMNLYRMGIEYLVEKQVSITDL